ncbi:MAG: phage holin family protein [Chlorobiaceae bacterium]|nr:phage holin family protein [Chlorobiaceae bacterium]NTV61640.1 phage holin family protein [Chlorobiaceae bacterium]
MDMKKVAAREPAEKAGKPGIHRLLEETASSTYADVMAIIEAKFELLKIELTEKIAVVSVFVVLGVILIIGLAYLVTTFALLFGELFRHQFLGYLLVSLVFFACFLFFTRLKPQLLKNLIQNILLSVHDYKK